MTRHPKAFEAEKFLVLARDLRKAQTPAEEILWSALRGRQLNGLKFRRQYRIYNYIVDFFCRDLNLIVEVDGEIHDSDQQTARDVNRDAHLESLGYRVLRFTNQEVLADLENVLNRIKT